MQSIFKVVANHCVEPSKAEDNLQKLHQLKNESVFVALSTLLNPCTTVIDATTARVCLFDPCVHKFFNTSLGFLNSKSEVIIQVSTIVLVLYQCHVSLFSVHLFSIVL